MQQTQMQQGVPYYLRFIENFPDVHTLAQADEAMVIKLWQGLGYYNRAKNLHHTAKYVSEELNGKFPENYRELLTLKGVGPYTAAAIASIVYGEDVAVIDGNVERVISRLFALHEAVNSTEGKKLVSQMANEILDRQNPGRHNQAIMDLGATICTAKQPSCSECPIAQFCEAKQTEMQESLPVKIKKKPAKEWFLLYFDLKYNEKRLIIQRPSGGIWPSLHEPPSIELSKIINESDFLLHWENLQNQYSFEAELKQMQPAVAINHQLTHKKIRAFFQPIELKNLKISQESSLMSATDQEINRKVAITRLYQKYIEKAQQLNK